MKHPLRILHVMRAPVGGLFRHVLDLSGEQARQGHEVGIVVDSTAKDALTDQRLAEIAPSLRLGLERLPMSRRPGLGDFEAIGKVRDVARDRGAEVLHGHGAKGGAYARLAARLLGRSSSAPATFYTPHGGSLNYRPGSLESRVYLSIERVLVRYTSGFIFESDYARRRFAESVGLSDTPARVIPNGLAPKDFAPRVLDPEAAHVLFIGELRGVKGVDVLLRALAALNTGRRTTAVIVGDGPDRESLQSLTRDLALTELVSFPGALPAREAFPRGRIMVVPSRAESFPYVVLEAAAAGVPLVSTNVGGIPEIVAETSTPLIPPDDVDALAKALDEVITRSDVANARAAELRERVARLFTVEAMTRGVLDFYASRIDG